MCINISTDTPGSCCIFSPCARKSPSADVDGNIFVYFVYTVPDGSVSFLFIKSQRISSAIINFDKVEIPVAKVQLGVLRFVSIDTSSYTCCIIVPHGATCAVARIGIETGFHSQAVNVIRNRFHPIRETLFVGMHNPVVIALSEIAVINIDIMISGIFQTFFHHQVGLMLDDVFADIYTKCIP